jgi:hypothetical protein
MSHYRHCQQSILVLASEGTMSTGPQSLRCWNSCTKVSATTELGGRDGWEWSPVHGMNEAIARPGADVLQAEQLVTASGPVACIFADKL